MENDDAVDSATYAFKGMSLGFEVDKAQAKTIEEIQAMTVDRAVAIKAIGNYRMGPATSIEGKPVEARPFAVAPDMDMLNDKSSPYNIDLETLSNLWVVRFGKEWVGQEVVEESEAVDGQPGFWQHTANRLRELGYLEMHTLASSYRVVMRLVE